MFAGCGQNLGNSTAPVCFCCWVWHVRQVCEQISSMEQNVCLWLQRCWVFCPLQVTSLPYSSIHNVCSISKGGYSGWVFSKTFDSGTLLWKHSLLISFTPMSPPPAVLEQLGAQLPCAAAASCPARTNCAISMQISAPLFIKSFLHILSGLVCLKQGRHRRWSLRYTPASNR